ncbi:MAG: tRNA (adenosine(37)-N6)-threonylcarbamoyltransferase complex transferase subunit TsaD [Candidatus Omnitrophica bacterium]|nr:tRNA (adenosine(37)-N6)-threonylcarbamoyltransferase complex transferase subunit TsaD [Candidatus Omnitrophota bacterium]
MLTLGIETSCDETAVSIVKDSKVLSNEISSSVHLHSEYGGVIPEIASRYHTEFIYDVYKKAIEDAKVNIKDIDLIAYTETPGLPGSLIVGTAFAKALSYAADIPLSGVDHLKAHIISSLVNKEDGLMDKLFPFIGVVISGGHTSIYDCRALDDFRIIGRTLDDAVGEAFDKVAKILNMGYPGGPLVEKMSDGYKGEEISFPKAYLKNLPGIDFSFSGIKTSVLYYWRDSEKNENEIKKICFSFQNAVKDVIGYKIKDAIDKTGYKTLLAGGGVINNSAIRNTITLVCAEKEVSLYLPEKEYCSDNAAMIAFFAQEEYKKS